MCLTRVIGLNRGTAITFTVPSSNAEFVDEEDDTGCISNVKAATKVVPVPMWPAG